MSIDSILLDANSQGEIITVVGAPGTGVVDRLLSWLFFAYQSDSANFAIFKHPDSNLFDGRPYDKLYSLANQRKQVPATFAENPDEIYTHYTKSCTAQGRPIKNLVIYGVNHYREEEIIELIDQASRAHINVIIGGINLWANNTSYNHIGEIMAISDVIEVQTAHCSTCSDHANRSNEVTEGTKKIYLPVCPDHHDTESRPRKKDWLVGQKGYLTVMFSPTMFARKTEDLTLEKAKYDRAQPRYLLFRHAIGVPLSGESWLEGEFGTHDGQSVPCVYIPHARVIPAYILNKMLRGEDGPKCLMVDEGQLIPGLGELVPDLINQGYRLIISFIGKDFAGRPFMEAPRILPFADRVEVRHALCTVPGCNFKARFSQKNRLDSEGNPIGPASPGDPIIQIDDSIDQSRLYQPRCGPHFEGGAPSPKYVFGNINK